MLAAIPSMLSSVSSVLGGGGALGGSGGGDGPATSTATAGAGDFNPVTGDKWLPYLLAALVVFAMVRK